MIELDPNTGLERKFAEGAQMIGFGVTKHLCVLMEFEDAHLRFYR